MLYLAEIHNQKKRQPVILPPEREKEWLNSHLDEHDIFQCIEADYKVEELESYPVHKKLHKLSEDSNVPDILEPFNYPELNMLF
jgi:putative SOS response-associated peptidase YedK